MTDITQILRERAVETGDPLYQRAAEEIAKLRLAILTALQIKAGVRHERRNMGTQRTDLDQSS
jgi:hypothetical protein